MLSPIRSFTLTSIGVVLVTATLAFMGYRSFATSRLLETVEASNAAISRSAMRVLDRELAAYVETAAALDGDAIHAHPGMTAMHRAIARHFQDFPIASWTLYDPRGRAILSTDLGRIGKDESAISAFRIALAGGTASVLGEHESTGAFQVTGAGGNALLSMVPYRRAPDQRVEAVLGMRADLTQQFKSIARGSRLMVLGILVVCGALCAAMYFVTRRAASVARIQIAQEIAANERLWINEAAQEQRKKEAEAALPMPSVPAHAAVIDTAVAVPKLVDDRGLAPAQQRLLAALPNRAVVLDRAQANQLAAVEARGEVVTDLRAALERNELLLHFQPIVCLQKRRIVGAEVLVRWEHPHRGLLMPGEFVALAEESGLIVPIGEWILERACQVAGTWARVATDPIFISVNVSARQFMNTRELSVAIHRSLARGSLQPSLLELEVTEGLLTCDHVATLELLRELRAVGVRLSAQDFGRSFCNLSHLKRYPLTALKIDGSFIRNYSSSADDAAIVTALMAISRGLGLTVTAQGLETTDQVTQLVEIGCTFGQGYAFGRPMTADDFFRAFAAADDAAGNDEDSDRPATMIA